MPRLEYLDAILIGNSTNPEVIIISSPSSLPVQLSDTI
jgi:hypothetical protein